jgi:hypothetical protein
MLYYVMYTVVGGTLSNQRHLRSIFSTFQTREREHGGEYSELPSLQFLLVEGEHEIFFLLIFSAFSAPLW